MVARWQLQEAKQHFSELIRSAEGEGAQFVTRHGTEVAVVINIDEYRRLTETLPDFKEYLLAGPKVDDLEIERSEQPPREIELDD